MIINNKIANNNPEVIKLQNFIKLQNNNCELTKSGISEKNIESVIREFWDQAGGIA